MELAQETETDTYMSPSISTGKREGQSRNVVKQSSWCKGSETFGLAGKRILPPKEIYTGELQRVVCHWEIRRLKAGKAECEGFAEKTPLAFLEMGTHQGDLLS